MNKSVKDILRSKKDNYNVKELVYLDLMLEMSKGMTQI
ncbi:hypothetical protein HRbin06_00452 [archaeon HR06]|nr:hypothetical protein HRbin06_00452 [archaeon HR06]